MLPFLRKKQTLQLKEHNRVTKSTVIASFEKYLMILRWKVLFYIMTNHSKEQWLWNLIKCKWSLTFDREKKKKKKIFLACSFFTISIFTC